jgi:hypothetical protein
MKKVAELCRHATTPLSSYQRALSFFAAHYSSVVVSGTGRKCTTAVRSIV